MTIKWASILIGLFCVQLCAQEHHLYKKPTTGSNLRTKAVSGPIPFTKSYSELTAEEKASFLSRYENFPESDEPPYPLKGLQVLYGPIYEAHQKLRRHGRLEVIAMIDETGLVETVSIFKSPNNHMSKVASAVLYNTKFKPAKCSGEPCKMEFPFFIDLKVY